MLNPHELSRLIKKRSSDLGFEHCGIAKAGMLSKHETRLSDWLKGGMHADMDYMERNLEKRLDPTVLVKEARSVIVVALNYYQDFPVERARPLFSKYALGNDYHKVIKDKLYILLEDIREHSTSINTRVFVDSAPVLEKAWAVEAGLGWIGKNSILINKKTGSYVFLGAIISDIELEYDKPEKNDYCGSCTRCIEACPTGAITENRSLDSGKCISYLTIESRGKFDPDIESSLNGYVFGCDICQDVCPWNGKVKFTNEESFTPLPEIEKYSQEDWKKITEDEFNIIFRNSPVLRTGYDGFKRNLRHLEFK